MVPPSPDPSALGWLKKCPGPDDDAGGAGAPVPRSACVFWPLPAAGQLLGGHAFPRSIDDEPPARSGPAQQCCQAEHATRRTIVYELAVQVVPTNHSAKWLVTVLWLALSRDAGAFVLCHSGDSLVVRILLPSIQTHPAAPRHLALLLAADQDHRSPAPPSEATAVRYSTCSSSSSMLSC